MAKWFPVYFDAQFFDDAGEPVSNGYLEAFVAGTSTHAPTYNHNDEDNANPIPLDPNGRCQLKLSDTIVYDFKLWSSEMSLVRFTPYVRIPIAGTGEGTNDHSELINRNNANQHIIDAITDLPEELADKLSKSVTSRQYANGPVTILGSGVFTELNQGSLKVQSDVGLVKLDAPYGTNPTFELSRDAGAKYVKMTPVQIEVSQSGLGKTTIDPGVVNSNNSTSNGYLFPDSVRVTSSTQQALMNFTGAYGYDGTDIWNYKKNFIQLIATGREVYADHEYIQIKVSATDYIRIDRSTGKITIVKGTESSSLEYNQLTTEKVNYNITPVSTGELAEGQSRWNNTDHTLDIGMGSGVTLQTGQEMPFPAKNVDGTDFLNGEVGYIFGASGQRISMKKPTASDNTALKAMFMATQDVNDNNTGFFNAIGRVRGLDTSGFSEGDTVYLDTVSGAITNTPPAKPAYQARMGIVENSHSSEGRIFFHPNTIPKLGDLSDCDSSTASQGDFLSLASDGVFKVNTYYKDWLWAGTGVNPVGLPAAAVLTEIASHEWHWVFINNSVMAFADKQMPHDYKEGTDIYPHIHFTPTVTGTYTGTWTAVFTIWPTTATGTVKQAFTKTAAFNKTMTLGQAERIEFDSAITGTGFKISALATIELTLALSAGTGLALLGFDGHYQADRVGSNNMSTK